MWFVAAALVLLARSSSRTDARGPGLPSTGDGSQVPPVKTGDADSATWFRRRMALAIAVLRGLEPPVPDDLLDRVALSIVAQWAHETAIGKAEYNFNLGGWTARKNDNFHAARDRLSGKEGFRWTAYPSLPVAVEDQIKRLIVGYPSSWALLVAHPESSAWIEQLGRSGYYTAPIPDYARAWATRRAELGRLLA